MQVEILTYTVGVEDPKQVIMERVEKDLPRVTALLGDRVLVATAPHADRSKGGVFFTEKKKDEGRFQGKVGLILKMGPAAFKYDGPWEAEGRQPQVGDWVFFKTSDSRECAISGISCRRIRSDCIDGIVEDPEAIY